MSGVFLSYSRGDRAFAEQIIQGLRVLGVEVWWDEDMPGVDWQEELERRINELAGVLVVWTPHSAASKNVKDEARLGLRTEKLINVLVGAPEPPFPFDRVNGLPLDGWTGREPHHGWARLVQTIEALIVKGGGARPGEITGALARRERALRLAHATIEDAEHSFQDAQSHEADAAEAASTTSANLTRAEEQLQRMVEMRASTAVLRTAQQELDDAQTGKDAANQLQRTAKAALSEASRALARAKAAQERLVTDTAPPAEPDAPPIEPKRVPAGPSLAPQDAPTPLAPAAQATRPPIPSPLRIPWLVVGAGVIVIALIAALISRGPLSKRSPDSSSGAASATAAASTPESGTPATASANSTAALVLPSLTPIRPSINGRWTLKNVACAYAIPFAVKDGALSVDGTAVKIASIDPAGAIHADADSGGEDYAVAGDTLTITARDGSRTTYSRCAD
jgi:hypothetical protein